MSNDEQIPMATGDRSATIERWREELTARASSVLAPPREGIVLALSVLKGVSVDELTPWVASSSLESVIDALALDDDDLDGPGAWERLAAHGVIPLEWVGDPSRGFIGHEVHTRRWSRETRDAHLAARDALCVSTGTREISSLDDEGRGARCRVVEYRDVFDAPRSVRDALRLGGDARALATVEALARECVANLRPFDPSEPAARPTRVLHRVLDERAYGTVDETSNRWPLLRAVEAALDASALPSRAGENAFEALRDAILGSDPDALDDYEWPRSWRAHARRHSLDAAYGALRFRECVLDDVRFAKAPSVPRALWGTRVAALASPFEPLLALYEQGYALQDVYDEGIALFTTERGA